MNAITTYFRESMEELELVRWPTRKQAVRFSAVVIAFMAVSSIAFGVVDFALSEAIRFILSTTI